MAVARPVRGAAAIEEMRDGFESVSLSMLQPFSRSVGRAVAHDKELLPETQRLRPPHAIERGRDRRAFVEHGDDDRQHPRLLRFHHFSPSATP
jgi:hypothetical protein